MAMAKKNSYPSKHLARTNEPEAKQQIPNILGWFYNIILKDSAQAFYCWIFKYFFCIIMKNS